MIRQAGHNDPRGRNVIGAGVRKRNGLFLQPVLQIEVLCGIRDGHERAGEIINDDDVGAGVVVGGVGIQHARRSHGRGKCQRAGIGWLNREL